VSFENSLIPQPNVASVNHRMARAAKEDMSNLQVETLQRDRFSRSYD
jgi:hypothetical protein